MIGRFARLLPILAIVLLQGERETLSAEAERAGALEVSPAVSRRALLSDLSLPELEARRLATEKALQQTTKDLELVQRRSVLRGRKYVRNLRAGFLPAGSGFDELVDYVTRMERERHSLERDVTLEKQLSARSLELSGELDQIRTLEHTAAARREEAELQSRRVENQNDRQLAFDLAFRAPRTPSVAVYSPAPLPGDGSGFLAQKGRLSLPVTGRASVEQRAAINGGGKAMDIATRAGAAVRSIAEGRVAFSDRYEGYGLTVIIDHGDRYYSVYGNLGQTDVELGQAIEQGAILGRSESQPKARLYLELRHREAVLDPAPWFGL